MPTPSMQINPRLEDERAAFEALPEFVADPLLLQRQLNRESYVYSRVQGMWEGWQARAALNGADAGVSEGWQDIATAPEGVGVLCYQPLPNGFYLIFVGYRTGGTWRQVDFREGAVEAIYEPILFQHIKAPQVLGEVFPLPSAPTQGGSHGE